MADSSSMVNPVTSQSPAMSGYGYHQENRVVDLQHLRRGCETLCDLQPEPLRVRGANSSAVGEGCHERNEFPRAHRLLWRFEIKTQSCDV